MLDDDIKTRVITDVGTGTVVDLVGAVPVGSVEFCSAVARAQGVIMPPPLDYPEPLEPYLGRRVRQGVLAESVGCFVKPLQTKAFEAFLAPTCADRLNQVLVEKGLEPDTACWMSVPVLFVHEWRIYVANHQVIGAAQYDQGDADAQMTSHELGMVQEMIKVWNGAPCAYALDVGRTDRGNLILVEVNDAWATGFYPSGSLRPADFARWCAARWAEMVRAPGMT